MGVDIDLSRIPKHIAIIMDGNGRWAKSRNLSRSDGHKAGVRRVEELVDHAQEIGVEVMTLYTFSTENWRRPQEEIKALMNTVTAVLHRKKTKLKRQNMRFQIIGSRQGIPSAVMDAINVVESETSKNSGLIMNLAFNYGARMELIEAVKSIGQNLLDQKISLDDISEQMISDSLYTKNLPDPDLLIRTSGEKRISNFLLWQLSYSEFYFSDKFWPDFTVDDFNQAILDYQKRERRYGDANDQTE